MSDGPLDFTSWLLLLVEEQSPVGDLARDVQRDIEDGEWPEPEEDSLEFYYEYLESVNACQDALDTLEAAWNRHQHQEYV